GFVQPSLIHDMVTRERWKEAADALSSLPRQPAADFIACLADHPQQQVFSALPVDVAAAILTHFPYYLQYVLLHTRSAADMRTILDELPSDEKMQFFDELPEEAWQTLAQEIGEIPPELGVSARPVASSPAQPTRSKPVTPSVAKPGPTAVAPSPN